VLRESLVWHRSPHERQPEQGRNNNSQNDGDEGDHFTHAWQRSAAVLQGQHASRSRDEDRR
jgi:hypothetical protein